MRDRRQILGPLHLLLSEACSHIRDAHVAAGADAPPLVTAAHTRSLACPFFANYRDNEVVNLVEVQRWVEAELEELASQKNAFAGAFEAYSCALALVKATKQMHGVLVLPEEPKKGPQSSC